jgi:amino acid transporter
MFQGWRTFVSPMSPKDFVASYISVCHKGSFSRIKLTDPSQIVIFLVASMAYFFKTRGFAPRYWKVRASKLTGLESVGPIVVSSDVSTQPCTFCGAKHRRGQLHLPEKKIATKRNGRAIAEWIWVWLK